MVDGCGGVWLGVGRCGWLGVDRCGWVWMGVVSKDFKGFLFVMYFCQVFVVLAGCGWVWLVVDGCGQVWLGVSRCGWAWLGALFRTALSKIFHSFESYTSLANLSLLGRLILWLAYGQSSKDLQLQRKLS